MAKKERATAMTEIEDAFVKSDRTTLSRTIKKFETNGIAHQIDDGTGIPKYAIVKFIRICTFIFIVPIVIRPFV